MDLEVDVESVPIPESVSVSVPVLESCPEADLVELDFLVVVRGTKDPLLYEMLKVLVAMTVTVLPLAREKDVEL